ncbi:YtxH domain-containing protein [Cellulomonas cellasea]|uniref:ElaB/YqjD/DUF883 family membrane-anchored ribosome-binding protein n=1 Tax=Cellulomonas cellasea TaxID=43670 RepID=A0A7W4UIU9_9CELL|nr:YtxH domain-containing protein [Cellulomonas cellasea]MBB2924485.1 ElaB/YqjD/DUF883 family membrane-anchored ribosome-binding protein [Cellulomonas cellasea]
MKNKAVFLVGAGVGYVLGTRAGRQQFEVIKAKANHLWNDPRVQSKVSTIESQAAQFAKEQGSTLRDKATSAVKGAVASTGLTGSKGNEGSTDDIAYSADSPSGTQWAGDVSGTVGTTPDIQSSDDFTTPDSRGTHDEPTRGY